MKLKFKKLNKDAKIPSYAHPGDVGLDLYSLEDYILKPNEMHIFYCGFALEFETGFGAIVKDKGSLAKAGIITSGGVFDAGYRGEYNVALTNLSKQPFEIQKGQKIAQLIILPVEIAEIEEVNELSDSSRKDGRFGSTGKF
jgi:dUTP pyrophosphatase